MIYRVDMADNDKSTDEEMFQAFWTWAKVHDPQIRLKFLKQFLADQEEE